MERISVSVIVAIYNAEKTLQRLIDSLEKQTMSNFEVLLIDDGSTDSSGVICDKIAQYDNRFKAFHKPNEGIGSTRQFGIEHAIGEYTIHADADDWVEPEYLESLYNEAVSSNSDMVICDIFLEDRKRTIYKKQEPSSLDRDSIINDLLCRLNNGPCNKLLKRKTYLEQNISFMKELDYGEDQLFNLQLLMQGASVSYLPKALYHYDITANPDSAAHGYTLKKIQTREKFLIALDTLLPDTFQNGVDNKYLEVAYMAVQYKKFTKAQYIEKYSFLSRVKFQDYKNKAFSIKLVTWISINCSYRLAIFFNDIKKVIRRFRR